MRDATLAVGTLLIAGRFNGPPTSGNGGFTAGRVAGFLAAQGAIEVTLRRPPPLDVPLAVERSPGGLTVRAGEELVAEARPVDPTTLGEPVPPVAPASATAASLRFAGRRDHPFPTCFVCGTRRVEPDGLEIFAGPPTGADGRRQDGRTAAIYVARREHVQARLGSGTEDVIGPEIVWAALDCPGGWTTGLPGRPAVLGRLSAVVCSVPVVGERCVVVGELDGRERRKSFTRTTAYGADGRELGRAAAVWIDRP